MKGVPPRKDFHDHTDAARRRLPGSLTMSAGVASRPAAVSAVQVPTDRARVDALVRMATLVALWSSLLLVTYWWVTGRGVQDLAGWETGLTSTGRLTGLLASVLLLAQVLLMSRIPVVERASGRTGWRGSTAWWVSPRST